MGQRRPVPGTPAFRTRRRDIIKRLADKRRRRDAMFDAQAGVLGGMDEALSGLADEEN